MAGSVNKVILVGYLGADPDIRTMNSGEKVAHFRIATSDTWRDRNTGERQERTEWHSIVIFNDNLVKVVEQYLKKGAQVCIEGKLQTRKWQDQNGVDRYTTEVVLQKYRGELVMLSSRSEDKNTKTDKEYGDVGSQYAAQTGRYTSDDDVPF